MNITVFRDKRIILGITGSIACYKSVDLASKLTQAGARVDVIMTEAAKRFITPLSLRSVTGRAVYSDMWSLDDHVQHVGLGERADLFVIAPATAHTIAKMASGLADNLLTVTYLAARCPILVAPAMDGGMYSNPATQANILLLEERGLRIVGPVEGRMASGLVGMGRMAEPGALIGHIRQELGRSGPLKGRRVVVTAGPTREPLDPVRFLSNYSSGKQGYALAQAAVDAGADVTLVSGPVHLKCPIGAALRQVTTAVEMGEAVLEEVAEADVLLMVAAVADYRPAKTLSQKMKKSQTAKTGLDLPLTSNPDILELVKVQRGESGWPRVTLGFAAETENLLENSQEKLVRKDLDIIVINDVSAPDAGFKVDTNQVVLMRSDGRMIKVPLQSKSAVAEEIIRVIVEILDEHMKS